MSRTSFMCIFILFMTFMSVCESMPANFHSPQLTQHHRSPNNDQYDYPVQQQQHNSQRTQGISQSSKSDDVPFGKANPLAYSPEMQERILEGVNAMVDDIAAEVVNTLEMLEMKKKTQQKQERHRRSSRVSPSENDQKLAEEQQR